MKLSALSLLLLLFLAKDGEGGSLYDILGVSRKAGQKEIRAAYKRLAREWHPDKNKSPGAQEKILEINKAYEILSGVESRRNYDLTGETDPAPSGHQGHAHNQGFTFFQAGNGQFHFHFRGTSHHRKDAVTTHYFESTILPESNRRLFLLNFYSDFCIQCGEVGRIWDEMREELQSIGIGVGSVHASHHHAISYHCGVDRVPAMVAVVDGRVFHYSGHLQARSIRNFIKNTIPPWVITELHSRNANEYISNAIKFNKPRAILFSPHPQPSLLYKSLAFSNQDSADFAFFSTDEASGDALEFLQHFKIPRRAKKLLVFKEYPVPYATIEESQLTSGALRSVIEGLTLHLPRLTSTHVMERVCGNDGRMCLILVVRGARFYNDSITSAFRAQAARVDHSEFSMAYIDEEKQGRFIGSLQRSQVEWKNCHNGERPRSVLLLRRKTGLHSLYSWFDGFCGSNQDWKNLFSLASETKLQYSIKLPQLEDEFAPGILSKVWYEMVKKWYQVHDYIYANSQMLTLFTMLCGTASMMCCVGILGADQTVEEEKRKRKRQSPIPLPPLTPQLYHHCVEHAHKSSIAVLLLSNSIKEYSVTYLKIARKHKNRRFNFFHESLKVKYSWLQELLDNSSMERWERELREDRNLEEEVSSEVVMLALFGAKKQFAIFPETVTNKPHPAVTSDSNCHSIVNSSSDNVMDSVLNTFGFDEEDLDSNVRCENSQNGEHTEVSTDKRRWDRELDAALRVWMERLEDGSLKRYTVDHWPQWQ